jgi:hypothetical protein
VNVVSATYRIDVVEISFDTNIDFFFHMIVDSPVNSEAFVIYKNAFICIYIYVCVCVCVCVCMYVSVS